MLIRIRNLNKSYLSETKTITRALDDINIDFKDKGLNFIVGESGSGKSTLLNIIGGIDTIDDGSVVVGSHCLNDLSLKELDYYRNSVIGFVFQELNLLDDLNVKENIKIVLEKECDEIKLEEVIKKLGIKEIEFNNVKNISTGQKQRVAIARTLIKNNSIILADEPTGSLDSKNGEEVIRILKEISKEKLVIVITHDIEMAKKYGDRIIKLKDGKVVKDIEKGDFKQTDVKILSKNLIKTEKLNDETIEKINEIKQEYNQKVYIVKESSMRKTKSLFKDAAFSETKEEDGFIVTKNLKEKMKKVQLNKKKFNLNKIIKLACFNLLNKKKILILTSILMIISLFLYGTSEGLSNYNKVDSYVETINNEKMKSINFIELKNGDNYQKIREENINILKDKYEDIDIVKEYLLPLKINLNKTFNGTKKYSLNGISEINDVTKYGYNLIYGKGVLNSYDEIVISEYFSNVLIKGEYIDEVKDIKDLIDKEIILNNIKHKIVGIIESKYLDKNLDGNLNDYLDIRDNLVFVKEGYINNYFSKLSYVEYSLDIYLKDNDSKFDNEDLLLANIIFDDYESNANLTYNYFDGEKVNLEENEILISESYLNNNDMCSEGCNSSSFVNNELIFTYNSNIIYALNNYKVVGTYSYTTSNNEIDNNLYNNSIIISSLLKEKINENIYYNYQILVGLTENSTTNENIIKDSYNLGLAINKNFTSSYDKYNEMISGLSDVINTISLIMLAISAVLLYVFIQNSISMSKRKMGILKSIGLSNLNLFSIFLVEALFIMISSVLGSSGLLLIISQIINFVVRDHYGFYFSALNIEIAIFLKLIFITIFIGFIALLVQFIKFNKLSTKELIGVK